MEKKYYKIFEGDLLYLLERDLLLTALENGGVDNWEWFGDSYKDFLKNSFDEFNIPYDEDSELSEIAEKMLQGYAPIA